MGWRDYAMNYIQVSDERMAVLGATAGENGRRSLRPRYLKRLLLRTRPYVACSNKLLLHAVQLRRLLTGGRSAGSVYQGPQ